MVRTFTCEECFLDIELVDYGVDHAQYFQGHGVSFTDYDNSALGAGNNFAEAIEDALEQACASGLDGDVARRALRARYPAAVDDNTSSGWVEGVGAYDNVDIECECGAILSLVDEVWFDGNDESECSKHEDGHEPDERQFENSELYYYVGLRW